MVHGNSKFLFNANNMFLDIIRRPVFLQNKKMDNVQNLQNLIILHAILFRRTFIGEGHWLLISNIILYLTMIFITKADDI
jgi:hypothetical protein